MKFNNRNKIEKKYDVYIAGPFFNPEQLERVEAIKNILDKKGISYFSPKDNCLLKPTASRQHQKRCFKDNIRGIRTSKYILGITDGKDMGTIWECGYGYARKIPIIYFAETLGDNQFNLMLAQSGIQVLSSRQELIDLDFENIQMKNYSGRIE